VARRLCRSTLGDDDNDAAASITIRSAPKQTATAHVRTVVDQLL
jgi:hypothetical protein